MKTTVSTREYERSHGRPPRGRGLWMFEVRDEGGFPLTAFLQVGLYSQARRAALRRMRAEAPNGVDLVVLP